MVNWQSAVECKRCQYPLTVQAGAPVGTQPAAYTPGQWASPYAPPPPPAQFFRGPNPYEAQAAAPAGVWRDGKTLVAAKDAPLPPLCVKCGCPVEQADFKRTYRWHPPAFYLLLFVAWLIYLIVALCVRKQATVYLGLCERHRARRRTGMMVGALLMTASVALLFFGFGSDTGEVIAVGFFTLIVGLIWTVAAAHLLTPKKIDDHLVWLNGVSPDYLAGLPHWPGRV
jgi:hypothetical protein